MTDLEELPRGRQIAVSLGVVVLWLLTSIALIATPFEFAKSLHAGFKMLGTFSFCLGIAAVVTEPLGLHLPTVTALRRVWGGITGNRLLRDDGSDIGRLDDGSDS